MCVSAQAAGVRMRQFRIITAFLLLLAGDLSLARAGAAAPARGVTARQLVRTVDSALAGVAQAAMDPKGGLDRRGPGFAPFWSALAGLRLRVSQIETAIERRDGDLFVLLDQGSADLGALRVAWARAGARNDGIAEGVRIASASYRMLRANYGREGLRHRQGGELSDAERRQFQRIQRLQRRLAESLLPLRERSRRRGDEATAAELDRFRREAERIAWAPLVLEAYLNALIAGGELRGEWEASAPYMRSDAPAELAAAEEMVQDLFVESDIGQVFTVDLGTAGGWSYLDRETEVSAGADMAAESGAVQFYQAADAGAEAPVAAEIAGPVSETVEEDAGEGEEGEPELAEDLADDEAVAEDGILEEEDLEELESPQPPADPAPAKASPPAKDEKKDSKPAAPPPASPPAAPSVSPPNG